MTVIVGLQAGQDQVVGRRPQNQRQHHRQRARVHRMRVGQRDVNRLVRALGQRLLKGFVDPVRAERNCHHLGADAILDAQRLFQGIDVSGIGVENGVRFLYPEACRIDLQ